MSKAAEGYRKAAKAKIGRLLRTDPKSKIDASGYTPPDALEAEIKTGARPVSKRLYKRGGKVHGEQAHHHAGRKARKSGGKAITANSLVNRDVREANEDRSGPKHVGAFKKGGRAHRLDGGTLNAPNMPLGGGPYGLMSGPAVKGTVGLKKGGKVARHHRDGGGFTPTSEDTGLSYKGRQAQPSDMDDVPLPPRRPPNLGSKVTTVPRSKSFSSDAEDTGVYPPLPGRKHGGKTSHPDEAEDKALIRKMVKPKARTGKKDGGEKWIQKAIKHPGALHKSLHVPEGGRAHKFVGGPAITPPPGVLGGASSAPMVPPNTFNAMPAASTPTAIPNALAERGAAVAANMGTPAPSAPPAFFGGPQGGNMRPPPAFFGGAASSPASGMGRAPHKRGGRAKHPDEAEDKALIRKMVKPEARTGKAHGGDCKCHRCMGGKTAKSHGGQAEEVTGTRPTGGRTARAHGGKAGKGKMNVNIIISGHGHRDQQQPMMPPGAAMPPPRPGAVPMPMPGPGGAPPMGAMPMPVPMPMQAAAPPPAAVPPMRASGGGVFPHMDAGGGGGLGRLEKIKKYGP